jgi:hypothetical protein
VTVLDLDAPEHGICSETLRARNAEIHRLRANDEKLREIVTLQESAIADAHARVRRSEKLLIEATTILDAYEQQVAARDREIVRLRAALLGAGARIDDLEADRLAAEFADAIGDTT